MFTARSPTGRRLRARSECMRGGARPLICEFHAHTTWSDGELSLGAVVDLYGRAGFDVLCVTDHVLRGDDPWPLLHGRPCVDATNVGAYLAEIERERARALSAFGLLLVPGFELTYNDPNPDRAGHAVAVGLRSLVGMDEGPAAAMGGGARRGRNDERAIGGPKPRTLLLASQDRELVSQQHEFHVLGELGPVDPERAAS
jgi:hypothetical protein